MSKFELEILQQAKLCTAECKQDGHFEKMTSESIVFCVGCGRGCHMPCHNVPEAIVNAVQGVPKNNRAKAYFGELSYLRIVCDNCANLLNCNVPTSGKACFLNLFNNLSATNAAKNKVSEGDGESSSQPTKKRKNEVDDGMVDGNVMMEMKSLLYKCFVKMSTVEKATANLQSTILDNDEKLLTLNKGNIDATKSLAVKLDEIAKTLVETDNKVQSNDHKLGAINEKLDRNVTTIDDGLQKGFNKLVDMTEQFYSPITPRGGNGFGYGIRSSLRQTAMNNRTRRNLPNGTPTSRSFGGPSIPTESGAATGSDNLFGPAVPRKLNFNNGEIHRSSDVPRKVFRHDNAIYIRYVDPSITPKKMSTILNMNEKIKEALDGNPEAIEITRLVKNRVTEDEISKRRFGVSYRIGCSQDLLAVVSDRNIWANHWEIRSWDKNFNNKERQEQRSSKSNFQEDTSGHQPMEK